MPASSSLRRIPTFFSALPSPQRASARAGVLGAVAVALAACAGGEAGDGGGDGPGDEGPADAASVAIDGFRVDVVPIGSEWYDYDNQNHILNARDEAYVIVRDDDDDDDDDTRDAAAVAVRSYYDADTGTSGVFTLGVNRFDGEAWATPTTQVAPHNIKDDGPICLALLVDDPGFVACDDDGDWDLVLRVDAELIPAGPLVVNNPGLYLRPGRGLRVAIRAGEGSLDDLVDPTTLVDGDFEGIDRADPEAIEVHLASGDLFPALPEGSRVLGAAALDGDTNSFFLVNASYRLVHFRVAPVDDGFEWTTRVNPLDFNGLALGEFSPSHTQPLPLPAVGNKAYYRFDDDGRPNLVKQISVDALAPGGRDWDLAIETDAEGSSLRLSPSATARALFDDEKAETFDEVQPRPAAE